MVPRTRRVRPSTRRTSQDKPRVYENLCAGKEMDGPLRRPNLTYAKHKYKLLGGNDWPQTQPFCTNNNLKRPASLSNNAFTNSSNRFPIAAVLQRQTMADIQSPTQQ
ncbi:hypothetical protein CPB85DRAFT_1260594 [Mucidula mucida]|nr:hypothetical protein CPB85DRAFT_1260594 [Mucidula mucida]